MSHPAKPKLEPELALTLFLILALQKDDQIFKLTGYSNGTLYNYKNRLMKLFYNTTGTDSKLIYHAAKRCPELVEFLISKYKDEYWQLVPAVRMEREVTIKKEEHDGHVEAYVWSIPVHHPLH